MNPFLIVRRFTCCAVIALATCLQQPVAARDDAEEENLSHEVPELATLRRGYVASIEKQVTTPAEAKREKLNQSFLAAIDRKIASATNAGDLGPILGLRSMKQSIQAKGTIPSQDPRGAQPAVIQLSGVYRKERLELEEAERTARAQMAAVYHRTLKELEGGLVKERRIDDAIKVKEVREEFEKDKMTLLRRAEETIASREPDHGKKVPDAPGRSRIGGKVIVHCKVGEMPATPPPFASVPEHLDDVVFLTGPNHSGHVDSAAGFILAVRSNGSVVAWGNSELGVIKGLPKDLTGVVEVAGSWNQGAARTADGKVKLWDEERSWDYKGAVKWPRGCTQIIGWREFYFGIKPD